MTDGNSSWTDDSIRVAMLAAAGGLLVGLILLLGPAAGIALLLDRRPRSRRNTNAINFGEDSTSKPEVENSSNNNNNEQHNDDDEACDIEKQLTPLNTGEVKVPQG